MQARVVKTLSATTYLPPRLVMRLWYRSFSSGVNPERHATTPSRMPFGCDGPDCGFRRRSTSTVLSLERILP